MKRNLFKRVRRLLLSCAVLGMILGIMAIFGQTLNPIWRVGHDQYELLPMRNWNIGTGFWDGQDPQTRKGIGGRYFWYGCIQRQTNIYP